MVDLSRSESRRRIAIGDDGIPQESPRITWLANSDGVESITVSSSFNGSFELSLYVIMDDHTDTREEAESLEFDTALSGRLEHPNDTDIFSFQAKADTFYRIDAAFHAFDDRNGRIRITDVIGAQHFSTRLSTSYWYATRRDTFYLDFTDREHARFTITLTEVEDDHSNVLGAVSYTHLTLPTKA